MGDRLTRRLFGTNGIRGLANVEMNPGTAVDIGLSIGTFFKGGRVYLGMDGRTSSQMLHNAVSSALVSTGCDAVDLGLAPTPAVQYTIKRERPSGGVMITASHNPPEFNGIKVIDSDGVEIERTKEEVIERIYERREFAAASWREIGALAAHTEILSDYKDAIERHVQTAASKARLRVMVDPGNGVGSLVTPYLMRELGCEVKTINSDVNGFFSGRLPEPSPENLAALSKAVKALNLDLGIAHDGDADRTIFVDERGVVHWGDKTIAVLMKYLCEIGAVRRVVTPVSSSLVFGKLADDLGVELIWTKVGSVTVSRKMLEVDAQLGGEENGGVFYGPHQPVRDGAMAAALMWQVMCERRKRLSELVDEIPKYYSYKTKVDCPDPLKERVLSDLVSSARAPKIELIDGLKVWQSEDAWVLIRPSGTEPLYRIFAEAKTAEEAERMAKEYAAKTRSILRRVAGNAARESEA
jgi:phosphomannomutase/phosphoglucomutase